ncbi:hypothetical protein [Microvirga sp. M2]|uniref:hypothetical protein n=1 Tax=Microvirga sp. M2 TaxID=3073270 RepID=UPI0039C320C3
MMTECPDVGELIQELSARLIQGSTATGTLQAWCEEHHLSSGPISVLCHHHAPAFRIDDDILGKLEARPGETTWYRRVQLVRGSLLLSEAENWFIPQRLPPEMADILSTTDIPFGRAIAPLKPFRRTLSVRVPAVVPRCSAVHFSGMGRIECRLPTVVLDHEAIVIGDDGTPLAVVREGYRAELVSFARPIQEQA